MKILAVAGSFLPEVGGMQNSTHQTLLALSQQGVTVELICPKYLGSAEADIKIPYKVIRISNRSYLAGLHRLMLIRKLWKMNDYDHLLLMGHYDEIIYGSLGFLFPSIPIILAAGTRLPFKGGKSKQWLRNMILCKAYSSVNKIIAISPATQEYIKSYCGKITANFFQIPRPIDGKVWKRKKEKAGADFTLVSFGRLEKEKNIQDVLEVVSNLARKISNIKYLIIGDGDYLVELKSMVKKLHLEDVVEFVGSLSSEGVAEKIQNADLCMLLSKRGAGESFGRVYVEAAALGIPSIGYYTKGVSVAVKHGVTGYLCELDDKICVENAINKLYSDNQLMDAMKLNAINHYKNNFTLEIVGNKIKEALKYEC